MLLAKFRALCFHFSVSRICKLTAILSVLASSAAQAVDSSDDLLMRFRTEADQGWKLNASVDEKPGTIKVTTKILTYSDDQLTKTEEKSARIRRKSGYYLFEPLQSRDGGRMIVGRNPHYSFKITIEDGKDGGSLSELRIKGEKGFDEIPYDLFQYLKPNSYGFISLQGELSKLVGSRGFKIVRAEKVDPQLIRIHFNTTLVIPGQQAELKGWMDFDPNNGWALKGNWCVSSFGTTYKLKKAFSSSQNDSFHPCESWESIQGPTEGKEWQIIQRTQFEMIDSSAPPDDIFTLSHYGLPDPMGVPPLERSHTWIWLLVAAVMSAALAILFAWLKRRRSRTVRTNPSMPSARRLS